MSRAETFAARVRSEFELNASEDLIVDEVCTVLDRLDVGGLSPTEARQTQTLLSRLLYQLGLPPSGAPSTPEDRSRATSEKARRASRARWTKEQG